MMSLQPQTFPQEFDLRTARDHRMRPGLMRDQESVSRWIAELKSGADDAAMNIWGHFYARLLGMARRKLNGTHTALADEEDVVAKAFWSFFRKAQNAEFPRLQDRNDLWQLLSKITVRKALNQRRDLTRLKRGGPRTATDQADDLARIEDVQSLEPTPENALMAAEAMEQLLAPLSGELRQIAIYRLEGFSIAEIAAKIGRSVPTIDRRLRLIRDIWAEAKT
jgi:DNA-directed RNA polymerase specialized sigma24 family protein